MKGRKWDSREDAVLRELTMWGVPAKEIAWQLNRTVWAVYSRREVLLKETRHATDTTPTESENKEEV